MTAANCYGIEEDHALEISQQSSVPLTLPAERQSVTGARATPASQRPQAMKTLEIAAVAYEPEGCRVYAGLTNGDLRLWQLNAPSRARMWTLVGQHKGTVTSLLSVGTAAGPDVAKGLVLSGSADTTIKVWLVKAGFMEKSVCIQTLAGHSGTITALVHKGQFVLSSSTDCTVRLWKAAPGRGMMAHPWFVEQSVLMSMGDWVTTMSFAASTRVGDFGALYAADAKGAIGRVVPSIVDGPKVWKGDSAITWAVSGSVDQGGDKPNLAFKRVHDRSITHLAYLPDHGTVLALSWDTSLRAFDVATSHCRYTATNDNGCPFTGMVHDVLHMQVLLVDQVGCLHVWDLRRERCTARKRLCRGPIAGIFICSSTPTATAVGITCADRVEFWHIDRQLDYNIVPGGHQGAVIALHCVQGAGSQETFQDRDFRVISAGQDNTIRVWDPEDMTCLRVLQEGRSEITAMSFSSALNMPITGHEDGSIRLWTVDTGSCSNLRVHTNSVTCLLLAQDAEAEDLLWSSGFDGRLCVWDIRRQPASQPHLVYHWVAHKGSEVLALAHHAERQVIMTAGNDCVIKVWHRAHYNLLGVHTGHIEPLLCQAFNWNLHLHLQAWHTAHYNLLGVHTGHTEPVLCLAFDGNFLVSGSQDGTIRLWDAVPVSRLSHTSSMQPGSSSTTPRTPFGSGTQLRILTGHASAVTAITVLPHSGNIVSCDYDGNLLIWDYATGNVVRKCKHSEQLSCLELRYDMNEILVGTLQHHILRFPAGELIGSTASLST